MSLNLSHARPLPIDSHLEGLVLDLLESKQLILEAPPGTGKTTRFPLALLHNLNIADHQKIYVLVPRRPAAKLAAGEAARLLGEKVGGTVGYQFRFEKVGSEKTKIWYVTEGTFLRKILTAGNLDDTRVVVIDEFHERSIQGDVSLAITVLLRQKKPELLLTVMSATMDSDLLKNYLSKFGSVGHRKIVQAPHPLEIEYLAPRKHESLADHVVRGLEKIWNQVQGDILVFLPGMSDIRKVEEKLSNHNILKSAMITPLHGELDYEKQAIALYPDKSGMQKIILSTNIAESSITIEGVRAVVDSGLYRMALDSPMTGISSLHTKNIAKSSAIQRSGRAARQGKGCAIRLFSEHDFNERSEFGVPEIRQNSLAEPLLQILSLCQKFKTAWEDFPWFEVPPKENLTGALSLLKMLNAVSKDNENITERGEELAKERAHPRLATLLIEARSRNIGDIGALVAAMIQEENFEFKNIFECLESFMYGKKNARLAETAKLLGAKSLDFKNNPIHWQEKLQEALFLSFPDRLFKCQKNEMAQMLQGDVASLGMDECASIESGFGVAVSLQERINILANQNKKLEIYAYLPVSMEILLLKEDLFEEEKKIIFRAQHKKVEEKKILKIGKIILEEETSLPSDDFKGTHALIQELSNLPAGEAWPIPSVLESLVTRLNYLKEQNLLPLEVSSTQDLKLLILESVAKNNSGIFSLEELEAKIHVPKTKGGYWAKLALEEAQEEFLAQSLSPQLAKLIKMEVPLFLSLPRRNRVKINYENGKPPWIESFVQDFFGMAFVPKILAGKVEIVVHLLTPAKRPMAVTTDLKSFFTNHYPKLRQEYQRRYPRHQWPLDPFTSLIDN